MSVRVAPLAVGTFGLLLALVVARVWLGAASEYDAARVAEREGRMAEAVVHLRRCLGWYLPLSPYTARSLQALVGISAEANRRGDKGLLVLAERAIHGGLRSTRHVMQPEREALAASDARLARLPVAPGKTPPDPSVAMCLLAAAGWLGFVLSAFALVLRMAPALRLSLGMAGGFMLFCLGLWLA